MLTLLSKVFEKIVDKRNAKYDSGKISITKLNIPVISVGNLSLGGTGKTPFTIYLANYLKSIGRKPGVVGRGYGRKSKEDILVSDGKKIDTNPSICGDEMILIAEKAKIPVFAGEKKYESAKKLEASNLVDCIIIDDGFQHRKLYRDVDIVLIDDNTLKKPYSIPKGVLREKLSNYKRADIVGLKNEISFNSEIDSFRFINKPIGVDTILDIGTDQRILAVSGIAKPKKFLETLDNLAINYIDEMKFKDHYLYQNSDIDKIITYLRKKKLNTIVTTEKDFTKLKAYLSVFKKNKIGLIVVFIETEITQGEDLLKEKIKEIF